jgi:hypothetical protein
MEALRAKLPTLGHLVLDALWVHGSSLFQVDKTLHI